jgi:hypothetical protein
MKRADTIVMANRITALELALKSIPGGPKTRERRQELQRELLALQDELENGPIPSYNPAADPLYAGLADEPEPARPARKLPFEPSADDRSWWAQQPTQPTPAAPKQRPSLSARQARGYSPRTRR